MKKITAMIGAVALSGLAGAAQAQGWYAGGYGAMSYTHDGYANGTDLMTYDIGYGLGGFVGYAMANGFRVEGELAYRSNDIESIAGTAVGMNMSNVALMANVLYDFNMQSSVKPHVGGGLGIATGTVDDAGVEYDSTVVAGQFILGVDYAMAPDLALVADYRLFFTEDMGFGAGVGLGGVEYTNSAVSVGLRKKF